ncbi:MAG TPA: NAD(P)H-dependent oxidoreductase [Candidatus Paceibacterota bacterium]|nr:NAD(P)H-dependent oxidoreductase [Candidatus Paceibacterota bacterium]
MSFFHDHSKKKKITILVAHPDPAPTITSTLALLYEESAKKAGHEVQKFHLGEMKFDPILHQGYKTIQELEPDIKKLQASIIWCDHFVLLYPNWWGTMPALLKGLFDRMWLPGFAFNMRKTKQGTPALGWRKRLKGKTSRVFVLSGTHPFLIWLMFGDYTNEIKMAILWFAGFHVRMSLFGPSETAPEWKRNEWRRRVARLGQLAE